MPERLYKRFNANVGSQPCEKIAMRLQNTPCLFQHTFEVGGIGGEMQNGAGNDKVEAGVAKWDMVGLCETKILRWKSGCEISCQYFYFVNSSCLLVDGKNIISIFQEVVDISARAAADIEDGFTVVKAPFEQLIKKIYVYVPEVF